MSLSSGSSLVCDGGSGSSSIDVDAWSETLHGLPMPGKTIGTVRRTLTVTGSSLSIAIFASLRHAFGRSSRAASR